MYESSSVLGYTYIASHIYANNNKRRT